MDGARHPGEKGPDLARAASPVPEKLRDGVKAQWDHLRESVEKLRAVERYQVVSIAYRRYSFQRPFPSWCVHVCVGIHFLQKTLR